MNADEIATIRNLRACNVSWHIIARRIGKPLQECREAISMPQYDKPTERRGMPWDVVQKTLFDTESEGQI